MPAHARTGINAETLKGKGTPSAKSIEQAGEKEAKTRSRGPAWEEREEHRAWGFPLPGEHSLGVDSCPGHFLCFLNPLYSSITSLESAAGTATCHEHRTLLETLWKVIDMIWRHMVHATKSLPATSVIPWINGTRKPLLAQEQHTVVVRWMPWMSSPLDPMEKGFLQHLGPAQHRTPFKGAKW